MTLYEDLLALDHFDWADDVEVLPAVAIHAHQLPLQSHPYAVHEVHQPEPSITTSKTAVAANLPGEVLVLESVESSVEGGCTDSSDMTTSDETKEELSHNSATTAVSNMMQEVHNTFGWRHYSVDIEPEIHHFNWLGDPVYQRSSTAPVDSVAIILADPKFPEARDDIWVQTLLHCAYTFLDPVVVTLEGAQRHLLLRRGSQLQQAAAGYTYKFYTPHGR